MRLPDHLYHTADDLVKEGGFILREDRVSLCPRQGGQLIIEECLSQV